jgi:hypothetical protein
MYDDLPIEAELDGLEVFSDNCIEARFQLQDGTYLRVQWAPDTPEYERLLEFLTTHASRRLGELGQRGIVVTHPTPAVDDQENE